MTPDSTIASKAIESAREPSKESRVFMELWQARQVQSYVVAHLGSKISLGDLAKLTPFTRRKFNLRFKASFGCAPGEYVRRLRIARAQELMTISGVIRDGK